MPSSIVALQQTAVAVATVLDASMAIAALTNHAAPQCVRLGGDIEAEVPLIVFQTQNAREAGGLLGAYLVDVELYAIAATMPEASALLAAARDACDPVAFADAGLDAIPEPGAPANSEPLDPEDVPFPEAVGVATTLTLAAFIPS
jgi:hypothetical protein